MAPKKKVERLVTDDISLNRAAVSSLARTGVLKKKTLETIAIKVIRQYKRRRRLEIKAGESKSAATDIALNDKKLMVQRVQSAAVAELTSEVKSAYRGEFYEWLPSSAIEPDPLHQLNYGKRFQLGRGEAPGDRYGCQCGMYILVDEDKLAI